MPRKKGEGSYQKLPNGTFEFSIELGRDMYGKRLRKRFYGKTEAECRKKYKQFLKDGEPKTSSKEFTLSKWLDKWLATYKKGKVSEGTYSDYESLAVHVKNHNLGGLKLLEVKPIHVTDFFSDKKDYSHSFLKRMRFLLNAAFESAIDNDYCDKNPVRRAEIPKKVQGEKEAFTEDEVKQILDFAKTDEQFGFPIYIMFHTGIRSGEMRALTVDKIDFDKRAILINTAVKRHEELGLPKNNKPRIVPMKPEVAAYLKENINKKSKYIISGNSFCSRSGFKSKYHWFFNRLNKHLTAIGAEPIDKKTPHSTRHTAASLWHKAGMPLGIIAAILGHHSTEVTDKYTHVDDIETLTDAVDKYDLFKGMSE